MGRAGRPERTRPAAVSPLRPQVEGVTVRRARVWTTAGWRCRRPRDLVWATSPTPLERKSRRSKRRESRSTGLWSGRTLDCELTRSRT